MHLLRIFVSLLWMVPVLYAEFPNFLAGERIKGGELKSRFRFSIGDFNGDEKKDIILISKGGDRAWVHCNEGTDAAPVFGFATRIVVNLSETVPNHIASTNSMQALDWEGDGDLDWLVCDRTCSPMLVTNTGTTSAYTLSKGNFIGKGGMHTAFGVDWDRDGSYDLILNDGSRLYWQHNRSPKTESPAFDSVRILHTSSASPIKEGHPFAVDWNNDGRMDILASGAIASDYDSYPFLVGASTVRLYLGTDNPDSLAGPLTISNVKSGSSLAVTDWNNDGKKDILVMDSATVSLLLYLNRGSDVSPSFSSTPDTVTGNDFGELDESMQTQFVDWNHDGRKDLMVAGAYNAYCSGRQPFVKIYLNVSNTEEPKYRLGNFLTVKNKPIRTGWLLRGLSRAIATDLNHDGHLDLCYTSCYGGTAFMFYPGDSNTSRTFDFPVETPFDFIPLAQVCVAEAGTPFAIADMNRDGLEDFVFALFQPYPHPVRVVYYPNIGDSAHPSFSSISSDTFLMMSFAQDGFGGAPNIADLDMDGIPDLLMGMNTIRMYRNLGTSTVPSFTNNAYQPCSLRTGAPVALPPAVHWMNITDKRVSRGRCFADVTDYDHNGTSDLAVSFEINHMAFNVFSTELWLFRGQAKSTRIAGPSLNSIVAKGSAISATPNPFNPSVVLSTSFQTDEATMTIFNLEGKVIRNWMLCAGRQEVVWDGHDVSGGMVPSGCYYAILKTRNGEKIVKRITMLK